MALCKLRQNWINEKGQGKIGRRKLPKTVPLMTFLFFVGDVTSRLKLSGTLIASPHERAEKSEQLCAYLTFAFAIPLRNRSGNGLDSLRDYYKHIIHLLFLFSVRDWMWCLVYLPRGKIEIMFMMEYWSCSLTRSILIVKSSRLSRRYSTFSKLRKKEGEKKSMYVFEKFKTRRISRDIANFGRRATYLKFPVGSNKAAVILCVRFTFCSYTWKQNSPCCPFVKAE